jgi:23S rRNA pseudouridine2605 synthase
LLFTNDGHLAKRLTHPSSKVSKTYHVHLDKKVTKNHLIELVEGVKLEDGKANVDKAFYQNDSEDKSKIVLELHSGRNRVIRRMMEALGYKVLRLDRTIFASLTKKNLQRGKYRHLTEAEVGLLHKITGLK